MKGDLMAGTEYEGDPWWEREEEALRGMAGEVKEIGDLPHNVPPHYMPPHYMPPGYVPRVAPELARGYMRALENMAKLLARYGIAVSWDESSPDDQQVRIDIPVRDDATLHLVLGRAYAGQILSALVTLAVNVRAEVMRDADDDY